MAALQTPFILKAFNITVDGRGYAGKGTTATLPVVKLKTEDHRGGGMDGPVAIDMGMEKLECSIAIAEMTAELMATVGTRASLTLRGSLEDGNGPPRPAIARLKGLWTEANPGDWKPGEKGEAKHMCSPEFYSLHIGGREVYYIDVPNAIRRINGVDQLAGRRAAIGV